MRNLNLLAVAFCAFASIEAVHADFSYPDFSNVDSLSLNGDSAVVDDAMRLSTASPWSSGSVFTTEQVSLGVGNSFSTYFQFQITAPGGIGDGDGTGADGLVFVVQTQNNNVGAAGEGIGYTGIAPSVGVEFDTFDNGFSRGDPDGNHVGINVNGTVASVVLTTEPTRFNDADVWNAWVDYNSATAELEVRWALGITRPDNAQLSYTLNLASLLGQDTAFVGFTSATGAGYGNHVILAWEYRGDFAPIVVPEPSGIALLAGSALVMFARPMRRKTETERGRGPCNDPVVFTT